MRTLPRHLLLAAVLLTVCCAERQAAATPGSTSDKATAALSEQAVQARLTEQRHVRRRDQRRLVRPAVPAWGDALPAGFGHASPLVRATSLVVHRSFPPSRFRLPPPSVLL